MGIPWEPTPTNPFATADIDFSPNEVRVAITLLPQIRERVGSPRFVDGIARKAAQGSKF